MTPDSVMLLKLINRREERFPNSGGMVPDKLLDKRLSSVSNVRYAICGGMIPRSPRPIRIFECMSIYLKATYIFVTLSSVSHVIPGPLQQPVVS